MQAFALIVALFVISVGWVLYYYSYTNKGKKADAKAQLGSAKNQKEIVGIRKETDGICRDLEQG